MCVAVFAAISVALPFSLTAAQSAVVDGVVLRVQAIRGEKSISRMLLSTDEGLCAVRVPGGKDDWSSYVDAEIEISGEMRGMEFVVTSQADVQVLKYPPTDPDALIDVLPAGELVQRRIRRQQEEAERAERIRRLWVLASSSAVVLLVMLALGYFVVRNRRRASFLGARLATERRRTGKLHENIEQQLSGSRYLLETALSCAEGTPKEISDTMTTVSDTLSDINRKVHRTASMRKPVEEMRDAK